MGPCALQAREAAISARARARSTLGARDVAPYVVFLWDCHKIVSLSACVGQPIAVPRNSYRHASHQRVYSDAVVQPYRMLIALLVPATCGALSGSGLPSRHTVKFSLEGRPPLELSVVEVNDRQWWERQSNQEGSNPFGAKLWPAALGVAKHLARLPAEQLVGLRSLDCGSGNGLCSLVLASRNADVMALDISPVALALTRQAAASQTLELATAQFDFSSSERLPPADLCIFADLLYDARLARLVADRVAEAARRGSWVIVGSHTRSGRETFLTRLAELMDEAPQFGEERIVRSDELRWKEKRYVMMQLNVPLWAQEVKYDTKK